MFEDIIIFLFFAPCILMAVGFAIAALRSALVPKKQEYEDLIKELEKNVSDLEYERKGLKNKIVQLESENNRLKEKANSIGKQATYFPQNTEIATYKKEIQDLTDSLNSANNEISKLKKKLKTYKKESNKLQRNYSTERTYSIDNTIRNQVTHTPQFSKIDLCWDIMSLEKLKNGVRSGRLKKAIEDNVYERFASPIQLMITDSLNFSVDIVPKDKKECQRIAKGLYTTTLSSCDCYYYQNNSGGITACKHMMALALYLNIVTPGGKINENILLSHNGIK